MIFVSRVLAETYAHLRNKHHDKDDSDHWKAIPLQDFDLRAHARGIEGPLHCMMTFGFSMESPQAVICIGAPRLRYIPLSFDLSHEKEGVTFSFNQWVFDFMRDEWKALGLRDFVQELEETDEMDATAFDRLLKSAIDRLEVCENPSWQETYWSAFSARQLMWVTVAETAYPANHRVH